MAYEAASVVADASGVAQREKAMADMTTIAELTRRCSDSERECVELRRDLATSTLAARGALRGTVEGEKAEVLTHAL